MLMTVGLMDLQCVVQIRSIENFEDANSLSCHNVTVTPKRTSRIIAVVKVIPCVGCVAAGSISKSTPALHLLLNYISLF